MIGQIISNLTSPRLFTTIFTEDTRVIIVKIYLRGAEVTRLKDGTEREKGKNTHVSRLSE